jgi:ketosteroid isomerase-like protein
VTVEARAAVRAHVDDIRDQLARYMRAMRLKDLDLMATVFTDDAIIDYTAIGGSRAGWNETRRFLEATLAHVEQFLLHVGDVFVTLDADGDAAEVETTWHGVFVPGGDAPPLLVFGSYDDRFRRTPAGWRIAQRVDHPSIQLPVTGPG